MQAQLNPNLAATKAFLGQLDRNDIFTFQTFDDNKADKGKFDPLAKVLHGTLDQHHASLKHLQQQGAGVFVMVNRGDGLVHPGNKTCRRSKNVTAIRSLFVDLDGSPIAPVLKALQPDIVVESSPDRWHAYWLTDDCPLDEFRKRQRQIAEKFAGDPKVIDLPRVMRLPGFFHQKATPFMTRLTYPV